MNRYLEKVAKTLSKEKSSFSKDDALLGAAGAVALNSSVEPTLGYHKLYHGTTDVNAESIRKNGFDPKMGGTGSAKGAADFVAQSTGKVHFTKSYPTARFFAGYSHGNALSEGHMPHEVGLKNVISGKGTVLSARVSDSFWNRMEADPHMHGGGKDLAATTAEHLKADSISKNPFTGAAKFLNKNHLVSYIKTNPRRFATGILLASGGTAALGFEGNKVYNHLKEKYE